MGGEFQSLHIRYRPLNESDMDKFVAARQGVKVADISATSATMDMMARACVEVVGKFDGERRCWGTTTGRCAWRTAWPACWTCAAPVSRCSPATRAIARLFGHNGVMLTMHGDQPADWTQDPTTTEGHDRSVGGG